MTAMPFPPSPPPGKQPTNIRYLVVALSVAMAVLLYLDRFAISPTTNTLLTELKVSKEQLGWTTFTAFFFAYALMQIPAGWLSDRWGARWTLAAYVVGWSLATACMGLAHSLTAIFALRFLLGITQAGAYPAAASLLKRWIPFRARGLANSSVAMGGRAGGLLAFAMTPALMLLVGRLLGWENGRWRLVFAMYGLLGLIWAALFVWLFRESPREHPWVNDAESDGIDAAASRAERPPRLPVQAMLASKEVWLMCVINFCVNIGWVFLVSWLPQYLVETHGDYVTAHIGNKEVVTGWMTALTGLGGMGGSIFGGLATDRLVARFGRTWGRRLPGVCAGTIVAVLYLVAPGLGGVWLFVLAMAAISFVIDFGLGASWASYQDIGGRNVASVLGTFNMCGNFGAALFSWLGGRFGDQHNWNAVFLISAVAMAVYVVCWCFFDASRPIVREDAVQ